MDFEQLIANISPEIYASLTRAIEIGKWPDGKPLTEEQKALCMEAVIAYGNQHLSEAERVGYIDRGSKDEGEVCGSDQPDPLKWT